MHVGETARPVATRSIPSSSRSECARTQGGVGACTTTRAVNGRSRPPARLFLHRVPSSVMAFRFRKSFKLVPGIRVNLSKRGASLSLGGRGFTTNLSSRGVRQTFSLPGTGMSWSKTYRGSATTRSRASTELAQARREAQYQEGRRAAEAEESKVRDIVEDWRKMPDIPDRSVIEAALQPRPYSANTAPPFPDLKLEERKLRSEIRREIAAQHAKLPLYVALAVLVTGLVLTGATKQGAFGAIALLGFVLYVPVWGIKRYLRISRRAREQADARWSDMERDIHAGHQAALHEHHEHESETKRNWEQLEAERIAATQQLLTGNREAVDDAVQAVLEELDFPFEATCAASALAGHTVVVAVDLPAIEDIIPEVRFKALKNGTIKQVRRSRRERNDAWRHLVLGIALQIGRTVCAAAPSIQVVKVAGYTQRRQRSGVVADEWVYELVVDRHFLADLRPDTVDPSSILRLPNVRVIPGSDGDLKKIPPPAWVEDLITA